MSEPTRRAFLRKAGVAAGVTLAPGPMLAEAWSPHTGALDRHHRVRGLMIDAGRVPESLPYYRRLIEFCAEWEFNTIQFRLADDQGSALRFATVPDLVTHRNAFTPDELSGLASYAQSHGIDLIPELESFGHTGFITRSARYAHLLDSDARGDAEFSGISPIDPESLDLVSRLYREVASIFPSRYLHGGCDEVNWGGSLRSRAALQTTSRARIWADYLNALHHVSKGLHKELIVWGDFVVHKQPDILGLLDKDVIVMDWDYSRTNSRKVVRTLETVRSNGLRCIGAPALSCYRWGARVGADQLRNVDAFADAYLRDSNPMTLGVMVTNWVPSRYLQNSVWDGFAYAAVALQRGSSAAASEGFMRFVERHYGAAWSEDWAAVFRSIYEDAPSFEDGNATTPRAHVPWSSDDELRAALKRGTRGTNAFAGLFQSLRKLEPSVKKNQQDFRSFVLSIDYLDAAASRDASVIAQAGQKHLDLDADSRLIHSIASRDAAVARSLEQDWNEGRPANAPALVELQFGLQPKDQLLYQWRRAADYSSSLAKVPGRFQRVLRDVASGPA